MPRSLRYASVVVLLAGVVVTLVGAWRIGVTWDEPLHVERLNNYLHTGWYLGEGQLQNGEPGPEMRQQYVYAPAAMLLLHGLCVVTGVEDPGSVSPSADAYAVRHIGVALLSLVGLLAVMGTGRLLFRRWDWAVVAGAALAVLPLWAGHAMFNMKDVPVGSGYALATFGLAVIARSRRRQGWLVSALGPLAFASGAILAVGTRPGMWTGMVASVVVLVACWLLRPRDGSLATAIRADLWRYRDLAVGCLVVGGAMWAIYPKVFDSPLVALWRAVFASANFADVHTSWTFVPLRVFLQVPMLLLGFIAFGVVVSAARLVKARLRPGVYETRLLLVLVQVFALPVIAIVHRASLYGDLRQLLFAAPASMLVATLGMRELVARARVARDRRGPAIVATVTCVALAAPLIDQLTLFPYDYAYYNPLASVARLATDGEYYRGSGRELVARVPAEGRVVCSPAADDEGNALRMAHLDGWVDCGTAVYSPISAYAEHRGGDQPPLGPDEFWALTFSPHSTAAPNCRRITGLTRRAGWRKLILATLFRCERPFPVLGTQSIRFDGERRDDYGYPDLGWVVPSTDGTTVGLRSNGGPSSFRFRFDRSLAGSDVRLGLTTSSEETVRVTFEGEPVEVRATREPVGLEVLIPRRLVERAVDEPGSLVFTSPAPGQLEIKVIELRATAATGSRPGS